MFYIKGADCNQYYDNRLYKLDVIEYSSFISIKAVQKDKSLIGFIVTLMPIGSGKYLTFGFFNGEGVNKINGSLHEGKLHKAQ